MNGKASIEDFNLKKSKMNQGKVSLIYRMNFLAGGVTRHPMMEDSVEVPHQDLVDSIGRFKRFLLESWGIGENEKWGEDIEVTGIDLSGKDEMRGVIITGKKKVESGMVAMNSPRIRLNGDLYGWEDDLDLEIQRHTKEIFDAIYEGKSAQLRMAFGEGDVQFIPNEDEKMIPEDVLESDETKPEKGKK